MIYRSRILLFPTGILFESTKILVRDWAAFVRGNGAVVGISASSVLGKLRRDLAVSKRRTGRIPARKIQAAISVLTREYFVGRQKSKLALQRDTYPRDRWITEE